MKTPSEQFFEKFCDNNSINWSPVIPSNRRFEHSPDYKVECNGQTIIVEVKEIDESPDDKNRFIQLERYGTTGEYDPRLEKRVREKINSAMKQLKSMAKGKYPAIIVLFDAVNLIPLEGLEIRLAMYGQDIVDIHSLGNPTEPDIYFHHRFGAGRKVGPRHNTTLSAIALLTKQHDQSLYLDFYHNKYAALPFKPEWLRKPNVKHYRLRDYPREGGLVEWELVAV